MTGIKVRQRDELCGSVIGRDPHVGRLMTVSLEDGASVWVVSVPQWADHLRESFPMGATVRVHGEAEWERREDGWRLLSFVVDAVEPLDESSLTDLMKRLHQIEADFGPSRAVPGAPLQSTNPVPAREDEADRFDCPRCGCGKRRQLFCAACGWSAELTIEERVEGLERRQAELEAKLESERAGRVVYGKSVAEEIRKIRRPREGGL